MWYLIVLIPDLCPLSYFNYDIEFRYQIIVSAVKFGKKFCEGYDSDSLVKEVSQLTVYCGCQSQQHG